MLNKCMYCQHEYGTKWKNNRGKYHERIATKDHITPIDKKGYDKPYNILLCCNRCNSFKGNLLLADWRDMIINYFERIKVSSDGSVKKIKGESDCLQHYKHYELRTILKSINQLII